MAGKGGAWKVAYADFVTAMMALFMVLWICSQDKEVLIATSRYFQQPFNSPVEAYSGILDKDSNQMSTPKDGSAEGKGGDQDKQAAAAATDAREVDLQFLNSLAKDFYKMLQIEQDTQDSAIEVQVTSDGLRVTLFDRARQPLFEDATARFTPWGDFAMQSLAWMIDRQDFLIVIEGHTRRGLALPQPDYTPWELSADRANAARRALVHYAVDVARIQRVTGFADTRPVPMQPPESEGNQRVALSLTFRAPSERRAREAAADAPPAAAQEGHAR
jgi:chemotaxis protein MotB